MDIEKFRKDDIRLGRASAARFAVILALVGLAMGLCLLQAARMQIFGLAASRDKRAQNVNRTVQIEARRGDILDRLGEPVAVDLPMLVRVEAGTGKSEAVSLQQAAAYFSAPGDIGSYVETNSRRFYPFKELYTHVTGYLGLAGPEGLKRWGGRLHMGDMTGKSGLEKWYDARLSGGRGARRFVQNAKEKILRSGANRLAEPGKPLQTFLDTRLQREAFDALDGRRGATVIMESRTGAILAMVTQPSFDANLLGRDPDEEAWKRAMSDPAAPQLNRALSGAYPPGSIFKILTAIAILESGAATPEETETCRGAFTLGKKEFKCWKPGGHGKVGLIEALSQSCDVYFYQMGLRAGITNIRKYAKIARLSGKTGIDLPGEVIGLIPDPTWKKRFRREGWYEGDTVNASIGQGFVQMSPMQALMMANIVANRGHWAAPRIADLPGEGKDETLSISPETLDVIHQGLARAVQSGTAKRLASLPIKVAGKTGTAEDPPRREPHAWFVSYAPADDPAYTMVVFVENGGGGAATAVPVAERLYKKMIDLGYFSH